MNSQFWKGKRVLITGHNGFKGCWLTKWLDLCGAVTCGISLEPECESVYSELKFSSNYKGYIADVTDAETIGKIVTEFEPDIVFHLAAQAIVKVASDFPAKTFETNVMGTVNVFEALRKCGKIKSIVIVTSDKVYENTEQATHFVEDDRLGGFEAYSASKACEEIVAQTYRSQYFLNKGIGVATARACNTFGGGDHHFDRLIPYLIRADYYGDNIELRNIDAVRPWQYILDTLNGYLMLAEALYKEPSKYSSAYNFGPPLNDIYTVGDIAKLISDSKIDNVKASLVESGILMIESTKSKKELGWEQCYSLQAALKRTCIFYKGDFIGKPIDELFTEEILNSLWMKKI